jgi:6-pyruvoyltetrahydropterin/6-carboxytetrahydropterin synthase
MFEVGMTAEFTAAHVMPEMDGPEGRLHEHDYRLEVTAARAKLDDRQMVCDLDVLEAALSDVVSTVAGRDLEVIRPPEAWAVTVEVLARWAHDQLGSQLRDTGVDRLSVRVWESPTAFGGYSAPIAD